MNKSQLFEDFIDGNLSGEELNSFLVQKRTDHMISSEIDFRLEINEAIQDKGLMEIREHLRVQMNNYSNNFPFFNFRKETLKTWQLAAASFALILVAGGLWFILSNKPYSTEKLVSKYYKPANPIGQHRSVDLNADDAINEAFAFYGKSDYTNALKYFNALENQVTARFYTGICYIELEKYNQAIESFDFVIKDDDNLLVEHANWYLGLIYLMNNQKKNAIDQFEKIAKSDSYYANQATDILKYLN